jgi:hypothetical protein
LPQDGQNAAASGISLPQLSQNRAIGSSLGLWACDEGTKIAQSVQRILLMQLLVVQASAMAGRCPHSAALLRAASSCADRVTDR